jgi:hypothetical protein
MAFSPTGNSVQNNYYTGFLGSRCTAKIGQLSSLYAIKYYSNSAIPANLSFISLDEVCTWFLSSVDYRGNFRVKINGGYIGPYFSGQVDFVGVQIDVANTNIGAIQAPPTSLCSARVENCISQGVLISSWIEKAGTVSLDSGLHAPATADDVTWRYTDRAVPAGATLRLRCAWMREGSAETRASVAVTDPATWWPQLWPLGTAALASVEFTGGTADWRSELLTWRNTGTEPVTVRVWECVTGTVPGGYLKVEEVKGGAL